MTERSASINRSTRETQISLSLHLDGTGKSTISTPIGFLSHMLELFSKHSLCDIEINAQGDTDVDFHHTVEDIGIVLGEAITKALGDKRSIKRYGFASIPMDEALTQTSIDLGGRPFLAFNCTIPQPKVGEFDTELARDFFQAVSNSASMNIHIHSSGGLNSHHIIESVFKSFARAIRDAIRIDPRETDIPSTKGIL